jgi:hypothetical protein
MLWLIKYKEHKWVWGSNRIGTWLWKLKNAADLAADTEKEGQVGGSMVN